MSIYLIKIKGGNNMKMENKIFGEIEIKEGDFFDKNKNFFLSLEEAEEVIYVESEGMGSCPYYDLIVVNWNAIPVPVFEDAIISLDENENEFLERWEFIELLEEHFYVQIKSQEEWRCEVNERNAINLYNRLIENNTREIKFNKEEKEIIKRILSGDYYYAAKYDVITEDGMIGIYDSDYHEFEPFTNEEEIVNMIERIIHEEKELKDIIGKDKRLKKARSVYWKLYKEQYIDVANKEYPRSLFIDDIFNGEHTYLSIWNGEFVMRAKGEKIIPITSMEELEKWL